jgi:hypothetical protein
LVGNWSTDSGKFTGLILFAGSRAEKGSTPVGVFVVHGGTARWVPAIDTNRIALIGVITGLISAVLASMALLRRPPWPDLSATSAAWLRR